MICFIHKTKHVARTILTRKRVRLRVRERVAFPYTFAVDVVNLNLSNIIQKTYSIKRVAFPYTFAVDVVKSLIIWVTKILTVQNGNVQQQCSCCNAH